MPSDPRLLSVLIPRWATEENKASAAASDVPCQAGTLRPGGASSWAGPRASVPVNTLVSQPSVVTPRAARLEGRGLADPVQFPLTWPLPPPLPGWDSSNKVFSLGLVGLVRWVSGASLSHLPPLELLKAGLDAPHCSLGSPYAYLGI